MFVKLLHPDPGLPGSGGLLQLARSCEDDEHCALRQGRERAELLHGWQRCGAGELREPLGKRVYFVTQLQPDPVLPKLCLIQCHSSLTPFPSPAAGAGAGGASSRLATARSRRAARRAGEGVHKKALQAFLKAHSKR
jgi:hypothetical protein